MTIDEQDLFRSLYEHAPDAVIAADDEGRIVAANPAARRMFGYGREKLIGLPAGSLLADRREAQRREAGLGATSRGNGDAPARPTITQYRTQTGRVFDGETVVVPVIDSAGAPGGTIQIIRDVTERLALRARLEASEVQLRAALSSAKEGAYSFNLQTRLGAVRGYINEFLGIEAHDATMSLDRWEAHLHPDQRAEHAAAIARLTKDPGEAIDLVYRARRADGVWRWLHNRGRVTEFGRDGTPLRITGVVSDVTDRKALEDRLADSEQLHRVAMETAHQGAWSLDFKTNRARITGLLREIFGCAPDQDEIDLKLWFDAMKPESQERSLANNKRVRKGDAIDTRYEIQKPDGSWLWIGNRGRVVEWDEDGEPVRAMGTVTDITEQKRLEDLAEERALKLNEALDAAGEGAFTLDLRTGEATVTRLISEMLGLDPEDGQSNFSDWEGRFHPDDADRVRAVIDALKAGEIDEFDYVVRFKHAAKGWIRLLTRGRVSRRDEDGKPIAVTGFLTDATERLETAERLAERDAQLRGAVDAATVSIWRIDFQTNLVQFMGPAAEYLTPGGEVAERPTDEWTARVHPEDLPEYERSTRELLAEGDIRTEAIYRVHSDDGSWTWHRASGRMTARDDSGKPRYAAGVLQDVHEWKLLQDAVETERKRFENIYRATPAMMHTINGEGEIVDVSDYWLDYLGYEREEVVGRRSVEFIDDDSRERVLSVTLPELYEIGMCENVPLRFIKKSGEAIDVLLSAFSQKGPDGKPVRSFAVIADITPLRAAYDQLERSNRELDRFATVASHDLQEPLRKIAAFAIMLDRRHGETLDEEGRRTLGVMVDAAQRMQRLIDDLLAYSKTSSQPMRFSRVDMTELAGEALERIDEAAREADAKIEIGELPEVMGDRVLLIQLLQNLISNAVKYRAEAPPRVEITAREDGDRWEFAVSDNGIGLEPRFAEKIFAPFQRLHTREAYKGTGIGLAIVQQVVERHGGRVWVDSAPGEGATFSFTLPKTPAEAPAGA
jgi:PAS domain S-box-containing protein